MTRFNKETAREELRTALQIKDISRLDNLDPTKDYHWVNLELTGTGLTGLRWLDKFLDSGWEIEYANKEPINEKTESKHSPQRTELKPSPETKKTQFQGKVCVLLSIDKQKHLENYKKEMAENLKRFREQQAAIKRNGRHIKIEGHEYSPSSKNS